MLSHGGRPGNYITVQIPGQNSSKQARCGSEVNSGTVDVLITDTGEYWAFCATAPRVTNRRTQEFLKVRPTVQSSSGKIKILFSLFSGSDQVFYVGGDRAVPIEIYRVPASASVTEAVISNTGTSKNQWTVSLAWQDAGITGTERLTHVVNVLPGSATVLPVARANSYLKACGHGFWASRLIAASFSPYAFTAAYGEASESVISTSGTTITYTITSPTVINASLVVTQTLGSSGYRLDRNGSGNNKGLGFWDENLEQLGGTSTWAGFQDDTAPPVRIGQADVTHTGSVYLAPNYHRAATTHNFNYFYFYGTNDASAYEDVTDQKQYSLWLPSLNGDQFFLGHQNLYTKDYRIHSTNAGTTVISNVNTTIDNLYLIDPTGAIPDRLINNDLRDTLLFLRGGDISFNLVGTDAWEVDIYNYNNTPGAPNFTGTIGQKNVNVAVNRYDLLGTTATPQTKTVTALSLKANFPQIYGASYHP